MNRPIKTILIGAVLYIALLQLTGCSTLRGGNVINEVRYGTQGLVMDFLENYPQSRIDEGSTFQIGVELENVGASDIEEGYLQIGMDNSLTFRGWEWGQYSRQTQDRTTTFYLQGRAKDNPNGEKGIITGSIRAPILPQQTEVMTVPIYLQACYDYETVFAKEVCIDPNPDPTINADDTCTPKDISASGQGGPVGVSKVEIVYHDGGSLITTEASGPERYYSTGTALVQPAFRIYFKNFGGEPVLSPGQTSIACGQGNEKAEQGIQIEAYLFDTPLECDDPAKGFVIGDGNEYVTCYLQEGVRRKQSSYLAPLVVNMRYGYVTHKTKQLEIYRRGYGSNEFIPDRPSTGDGYYQSGE